MNLPGNLASLRKARGLSQAALAKRLGVSAGTVAGWETKGAHAHGMRIERLAQIARVLKVDVAELIA